MTSLLLRHGIVDHRSGQIPWADFGANRHPEPVKVFGGDPFHLMPGQFLIETIFSICVIPDIAHVRSVYCSASQSYGEPFRPGCRWPHGRGVFRKATGLQKSQRNNQGWRGLDLTRLAPQLRRQWENCCWTKGCPLRKLGRFGPNGKTVQKVRCFR